MSKLQQERPIARIDYLSSAGMVGERCYHYDYEKFLNRVKEDNYYGTPMEITVFCDEHGKTIPLDFMMELDPLPQGFRIEDYHPKQKSSKKKYHEIEIYGESTLLPSYSTGHTFCCRKKRNSMAARRIRDQ